MLLGYVFRPFLMYPTSASSPTARSATVESSGTGATNPTMLAAESMPSEPEL